MNGKEAAHAKPQRKARLFGLEEKRGSCFAAWREAVFAVAVQPGTWNFELSFSTWNLEPPLPFL
jgi:hypothetical protein